MKLRSCMPRRLDACPMPRDPANGFTTLRTSVAVRPGQMCLRPVGRDAETLAELGFPVANTTIAQPRAWRGVVLGADNEDVGLLIAEVPSGRTIEATVNRAEVEERVAIPDTPVLVLTWKEHQQGNWVVRRKVLRDAAKG